MNMMTRQEELEELAVPDFRQDLLTEFKGDDSESGELAELDSAPSSLWERFAWFHDLKLSAKIHTVFGTFFAVGFAMSLILGLGLSELWARYQVSAQVQDAVLVSAELRGTTGELRYNTARYLFEGEPAILERQRESFATAISQLDAIDRTVTLHVPQLADRVTQTRTQLAEYNATFEQAIGVAQNEGRTDRSEALAYEVSDRGDKLVEESRNFATDFDQASNGIEEAGIDYFFAMVSIVTLLGLFAGIVLVFGLTYLSRDFSRKITEVSNCMKRLAKGDGHFQISGRNRKDEIGDMVSALELFKHANRKLEAWTRERTERAEEEVRIQRERESEREEAVTRKANLLTEVAQQFERTVGEVVLKVADASSELHSTATKMSETAEETTTRTALVAQDMADANSGATAAAAASDFDRRDQPAGSHVQRPRAAGNRRHQRS